MVGGERRRAAGGRNQDAAHAAVDERPQGLHRGLRDGRQPDARHAPVGERPVITREEGHRRGEVIRLVPAVAERLRGRDEGADERRPLERGGHVPERQAVPDPAELEAHHPDEIARVGGPSRVDARAQHRPLLAPEEGEPHAEPPRRMRGQPGAEGAQDADRRRVVVGAGTPRHGVVMGGEHERPRPGPEIHEEVDARALDGPIRMAADRQATSRAARPRSAGPAPGWTARRAGPPCRAAWPRTAGDIRRGRAAGAEDRPRRRFMSRAAVTFRAPPTARRSSEPPAPRPLRASRRRRRRAGTGRREREQARRRSPLVAAATVAIGRPRSSATRAAVIGR